MRDALTTSVRPPVTEYPDMTTMPDAADPAADPAPATWDDSVASRLGDDRLREECGVFGVFGHDDAAALTALGLHALQHRGQEGCGIVSTDGRHFNLERRLGLVGDNFNSPAVMERLKGRIAVGHNRYSTTGAVVLRNVQPFFADLDTGGFAIGHNGNLTNALTIRRELIAAGAVFRWRRFWRGSM